MLHCAAVNDHVGAVMFIADCLQQFNVNLKDKVSLSLSLSLSFLFTLTQSFILNIIAFALSYNVFLTGRTMIVLMSEVSLSSVVTIEYN